MKQYKYQPISFFCVSLVFTWIFWGMGIFLDNSSYTTVFMFLGLLVPAITAIGMICLSGNQFLKKDLWNRLTNFALINGINIFKAIVLFFVSIILSILISVLFGQSLNQFNFVNDFSFSGPGLFSAFITLLLASIIEEIGWRGYAQDALAHYYSWIKTSFIFGVLWAMWHIPLFWIQGTYHAGLKELGLFYVVNFFLSTFPIAFMSNWVYVKNNRSILACVFYHLFLNFMQEKIAMTPFTKIIETIVLIGMVFWVVFKNRDMFFNNRIEKSYS